MALRRDPVREWLCDWLEKVKQAPPPEEIQALHFGLFECPEGYKLYLTGSAQPDPWGGEPEPREDWAPEGEQRYAEGELGSGGRAFSPQHAQTLVGMQLKALIDYEGYDGLFKGRAVTLGFADGPIERLA